MSEGGAATWRGTSSASIDWATAMVARSACAARSGVIRRSMGRRMERSRVDLLSVGVSLTSLAPPCRASTRWDGLNPNGVQALAWARPWPVVIG